MIKSANQQYKESGSDLPFKKWLKGQQDKGQLKDHEGMFNADGETEAKPQTTKRAKVDLGKWNMLAIISVASLIYGLMKVSNAGGSEGLEPAEASSE